MELFKQLPIRGNPESWPPFPDAAKSTYPLLADRFEVVDSEILPAFLEQDAQATAAQIRYRRFRLALMIGAGLTTIAGALLAALGGATWPGLMVAILGIATTALANVYRRDQPLERYLISRSKAEHLRSIYFRYLSGTYPGDQRTLEREVQHISRSRSSEAGNG